MTRGEARVIESLDELHRRLPEMVRQQDKLPGLAVAALANPLLAIERLGYRLAPGIERAAEHRIRFGAAEAERLDATLGRLHEALGPDLDPRAPAAATERLLALIDAGPEPDSARTRKAAGKAPHPERPEIDREALVRALAEPVPPRPAGTKPAEDPLARFAGAHPLLRDLVDYRALDASRPRLADRELFEAVLAQGALQPVRAARFVYKPRPERRSES